jgi:ketosteroid isomerase-like protein
MRNTEGRPSSAARLVVVAVLALVAVLVSAAGVAAQATDAPSVVQRFLEARNAGNVAGTMALVADDVRFVGGPFCTPDKPCIGKDAVRQNVVDNFIPGHTQATIVGTPQVSGDQVKARAEQTADLSREAGVDRFIVNLTLGVRDGKITSYVGIPDASDPQTARFLAYSPAHATSAPSALPRTGDGGPLASVPTMALVGGILLTVGLAVRRSIQLP